jgi:hypothetical protein
MFLCSENQQRNVLAVANTNEGSIFVDPAYSGDLTSYISALLPTISPRDAKLGAELYEGLGSVLDQAIRFDGECESLVWSAVGYTD